MFAEDINNFVRSDKKTSTRKSSLAGELMKKLAAFLCIGKDDGSSLLAPQQPNKTWMD